ncbi:MAG: hypothetical protein AB1405_06330 [Bdellovibrionota bacterium]
MKRNQKGILWGLVITFLLFPAGKSFSADKWLKIEEAAWIHFVDEPGHHLHRGRDRLIKKEWKNAAADVRRTGAFLRLELPRIDNEKAKTATDEAIAALKSLGDAIDSGNGDRSASRYGRVAARAHWALAVHHYFKAEEVSSDAKEMAARLKAAAKHVRYAAAWTDVELKEDPEVSDENPQAAVPAVKKALGAVEKALD